MRGLDDGRLVSPIGVCARGQRLRSDGDEAEVHEQTAVSVLLSVGDFVQSTGRSNTYLGQTGLSSPPVHLPSRFRLDPFDETVTEPLGEFVERDEIVAFLSSFAGFVQSSIERRAGPHVPERVCWVRREGCASWPDGQEKLKQRRPQQRKWEGFGARWQVGLEVALGE